MRKYLLSAVFLSVVSVVTACGGANNNDRNFNEEPNENQTYIPEEGNNIPGNEGNTP